MQKEGFNLLNIKNDIKWHLDQIKDEYVNTLGDIQVIEIKEDKIVLECYPASNLSDVEQSSMEDGFLDDYYNFLSKHHPEVKEKQISLSSIPLSKGERKNQLNLDDEVLIVQNKEGITIKTIEKEEDIISKGCYGCNREYTKIVNINEDTGNWYLDLCKIMIKIREEYNYSVAVDGLLLYIADLFMWSNTINIEAIMARLDVALKTVGYSIEKYDNIVYVVYHNHELDRIFQHEESAIEYIKECNKKERADKYYYKKIDLK